MKYILILMCLGFLSCSQMTTQKQEQTPSFPCQLDDKSSEELARLNQLIENNTENADLFYQRSLLYPAECFAEEKLKDISLAIRKDPKQAKFYLLRGTLYQQENAFYDLERAIENYSQGLKLKPENSTLLLQRGQAYREKKACDKAKDDFKSACELGSTEACQTNCP